MIHVVNFQFKAPDDALVINTTSRSSNWSRGLSPFFVGPVDLYNGFTAINVENGWQFSKVYPYYADEDGNPSDRYFKWAEEGWNDTKAHRYPMGRDTVPPLYSWWDGEKLSYVEARKKIYIPLYSNAVRKTSAFEKLKELHDAGETLYLQDFDAHNLVPGDFDYMTLVNNSNIKVGHAYVLAMMLEGIV
jgi:hypothetical protein